MGASGSHDVIVVGVGGVGSAATYHLARRGVDVLGIERFDVPHGRGSSHGRTRLFQRALDADPAAAALADRARDLWRDLERERGVDLFAETGTLAIGPPGADPVASAERVSRRRGLEHDVLSGGEINERYPGFDFPDDHRGVFQPGGGVLACERGVVAHVRAALDEGATVRGRERVVDWSLARDGVRVETDRGRYDADALVVTAGAWAARAVDELDGLLEPLRHATAWFDRTGNGNDEADPPGFVASVDGEDFYGVPGIDLPGVKVGAGLFEPVDPDALAGPDRDDERPLREFAEARLPGFSGPTLRLNSGLITRSPDGEFVVDALPRSDRIVVGAGFSGRGYKFAPALGEVLADLAVEGGTDRDISRYALDRFD